MKGQLKQSMAWLLVLLTLLSALPTQAITQNRNDKKNLQSNTLSEGGCFVLYWGEKCLSSDIMQNGGLYAKPLPENGNEASDNTKWTYTDSKLKCGELYLCSSGENLFVSTDVSYALTAIQNENIQFFTLDANQIYITYNLAYDAFTICNDENLSCKFLAHRCSEQIEATQINLDADELALKVGETYTLNAQITPQNATDIKLSWQSEDSNIASVENGTVTAKKEGQTTITVAVQDTNLKDSCTVTVSDIYYTVRFFDKDNSIISTQSVKRQQAATAPMIPTHNGYEFFTWDTDFSCITSDTDVHSVWNPIIYNISYELYGATLSENAPTTYTIESQTLQLPTASKRGFNFMGWYTNPEFIGNSVTSIPSGSFGDKVFHASFAAQKYSVTYELNGGSFTSGAIEYYTVISPDLYLPVPIKRGYTFAGWYTTPNFSGDSVTFIPTGSIGNVKFFASWVLQEYTVTYICNGGVLPQDAPLTYNTESRVVLPLPTRRGYLFKNWFETSDFSGEPVTSIEVGTVGDKTFYGAWQAITYNIFYNTNGGTLASNAPTQYTVESNSITLPIPTKKGYTFCGWYETSDFTSAQISVIEKGSVGNKVFFARWETVKYTISFNLNGGTFSQTPPAGYTIESADIVLPIPTKNGYTFGGWYESQNFAGEAVTVITGGSVGSRTFFAKWTPIVYQISLNANGGIIAGTFPSTYTIESDTITLPQASKRGYSFMGWYNNASFSGQRVYTIERGSFGDISLYAKWQTVQYSITYNANGGIISENAVYSYTVESQTFALPTARKAGYNFMGWYADPDFLGNAVSIIVGGSVGNKTFYARFEAIVYSINYELFGGTLSDTAATTYTVESNSITLQEPQKTGYAFMGYYLSADFNGEKITVIPHGSIGDITLYAKWQLITYTITYHVFDGIMPADYETTYTVESDTITLPRPTLEGHVFVGWYDNEALSGIAIREIKAGSYGNLEFFANWRKLIYTVRFFDWDGETLLHSTHAEYGSAAIPPETVPQHYGYDFSHWDKDISCITSNLDCIAVYELTEHDVTFVDLDYSIIEVQKVKHGFSATAPEPPKHDDCVFVFWSCDFSCVIEDLTVVAVYRATTVPPTPSVGQRFVTDEYMEGDEDYILATETENGIFALTSLCRFETDGLWAVELNIQNNIITPSDQTASLEDAVFHTVGAEYSGFTLSSESSGKLLTCESGNFTMCTENSEHDLFSYRYQSGAWRLYNKTKSLYLCFNEQDGYFTAGDLDNSARMTLYKRINLPDYLQVTTPQYGKNYTIVAMRPDGKSFALSYTQDGILTGLPVDVINSKLHFNDNINEQEVSFRMTFGNNDKGFNIRHVASSRYLGIENGDLALTSSTSSFWVLKQHSSSEYNALTEIGTKNCLFCDENGNFSASSPITHSQILLFERRKNGGLTGDVNLDGTVNTGDATVLLKYIAETISLHEDQLAVSDTNGDGRINSGDCTMILRYVVGLSDWM